MPSAPQSKAIGSCTSGSAATSSTLKPGRDADRRRARPRATCARGSTSFSRSLNERRSTRSGSLAVSSFCHQRCREWTKKPLFVPLLDDLRQALRLAGLAGHHLARPASSSPGRRGRSRSPRRWRRRRRDGRPRRGRRSGAPAVHADRPRLDLRVAERGRSRSREPMLGLAVPIGDLLADDVEVAVVVEVEQPDAVVPAVRLAEAAGRPSRFLFSRSCASRKLRNLTFFPCFFTAWSISSTTCSVLIQPWGWKTRLKTPCLSTTQVERRLQVLDASSGCSASGGAGPPSRWGRRRGTPSRGRRSRRDRDSSRSC